MSVHGEPERETIISPAGAIQFPPGAKGVRFRGTVVEPLEGFPPVVPRPLSPLAGFDAKMRRSVDLLEELRAAFEDAMRADAITVTVEERGDEFFVVARVQQHPPLVWGVKIGEFLHGVRSALEYVAFQLVLANGGTPHGTAFPIFEQRSQFEAVRTKAERGHKGPLTGMSPKMIKALAQLQPFEHSPPADHPLEVLRRLSNRDKHHVLQVVAGAVRTTGCEVAFAPEGHSFEVKTLRMEAMVVDETVLIHAVGYGATFSPDPYYFRYAFAPGEPYATHDVLATLADIYGCAAGVWDVVKPFLDPSAEQS